MSLGLLGDTGFEEGVADLRQCKRQCKLQLVIELVDQFMWGLCNSNHGSPSTIGDKGDKIKKKEMVSRWLPES